jgi:dephospho-CoA kinase
MLAAQLPRARRLAEADDVLENSGDLALIRASVTVMHDFYRKLAADGRPRAPGLRLPDPVI